MSKEPLQDVVVRKYAAGDKEAVFGICGRSPEAAQWLLGSYDQAEQAGQIILVAEVGRKIGGFVVTRFVADEGEILNMAVEPQWRGRGVGARLMTAAMSEAQKHTVKRMYLEVRESNTAAKAFYERQGFSAVGKRSEYYSGPTENAVVMKKLTD